MKAIANHGHAMPTNIHGGRNNTTLPWIEWRQEKNIHMQINRYIHAIKIPFYVTTPSGVIMERSVHVYLIYGTNGICLIDTGVASAYQDIVDYIRKTDRRVEDISLIIQTHAHPDHIGSTRTIKAEAACAVAMHAAEKAWLEDVRLQAAERPVPGFESLVAGSVAVNRLLEDGEVFDLGCGLKLQVFHTPGHSKGSISILLLGFMALFCGDAVPLPGELPVYEDVLASLSSIRRLQAIDGIRHLLPAWGEPASGAEVYQRLDEGLLYLQRVHEAVLRVADNAASPDPLALCGKVLAVLGIPPEAANPITARAIAAHLAVRHLEKIV